MQATNSGMGNYSSPDVGLQVPHLQSSHIQNTKKLVIFLRCRIKLPWKKRLLCVKLFSLMPISHQHPVLIWWQVARQHEDTAAFCLIFHKRTHQVFADSQANMVRRKHICHSQMHFFEQILLQEA